MPGSRFFTPYASFVDGDGVPRAGAQLFFYVHGTSTPSDTYADADLVTPNTNPVTADAAGQFPSIFLDEQIVYKAILCEAPNPDTPLTPGVQVWTADPVQAALLYETGTWAPTVSFVTLGDLTVVYVTRNGTYTRIGDSVQLRCDLIFTPTYTTAAGAFRLTGLPYAAAQVTSAAALSHGANLVYDADATNVCVTVVSSSALAVVEQGTEYSAQAGVIAMPTGVTQHLTFNIEYPA